MSLLLEDELQPVSVHALRRWIERVEGVDVAEGTDDLSVVLEAWRSGMCDLRDIHRRMMTPLVRSVCAMGNGSVKQGRHTVIIRGGRVLTVVPTMPSKAWRDRNK